MYNAILASTIDFVMSKETISHLSLQVAQVVFLAVGLYKLTVGDWLGVFVVLQAMVVSVIPYLVKRVVAIHVPHFLRIGITLFMFATLILGEIGGFYTTFAWWDLALHAIASAGLALIGFIVLVVSFRQSMLRIHALLSSVLAVSFALALGVMWEVYEFFIDVVFLPDPLMQSSNTDTMTDLVISIVGAVAVAVGAYRYLRWRERGIVGKILEEGKVNN